MRMTKQRQAILHALRGTREHPSADTVFHDVRRSLPNISLATIYRNLRQLSEAGLVQELSVGDARSRFDANTSLHYHVRCVVCGRIDDLDMAPHARLEELAREVTEFDLISHHIEFMGVCPKCARQRRAAES